MGSSPSVTVDMFKLFCKYCSVFENQLPMTAGNFARPSNPILFKNNADTQRIGETAVREFKQSQANQPQAAPVHTVPTSRFIPDQFGNNPSNVPAPKPYQPPQTNMGNYQQDFTGLPQMNQTGYPQPYSTRQPETPKGQGVAIFEQNTNGFLSGTASNDTSFTSNANDGPSDFGSNNYPRPASSQTQGSSNNSNTGSEPYKITIAEFQELVNLIDGVKNKEPGFYTKGDLKDLILGSNAPKTSLKPAWEMFDTTTQQKIKREGTLVLNHSCDFVDMGAPSPRPRS